MWPNTAAVTLSQNGYGTPPQPPPEGGRSGPHHGLPVRALISTGPTKIEGYSGLGGLIPDILGPREGGGRGRKINNLERPIDRKVWVVKTNPKQAPETRPRGPEALLKLRKGLKGTHEMGDARHSDRTPSGTYRRATLHNPYKSRSISTIGPYRRATLATGNPPETP
jgi:hypothetical protein